MTIASITDSNMGKLSLISEQNILMQMHVYIKTKAEFQTWSP
jgi:hypothetical protein